MCPSLIEIGSKTAEKNCTNKQTDRQTHYENNGHLAVNQYLRTQLKYSNKLTVTTTSTLFQWRVFKTQLRPH